MRKSLPDGPLSYRTPRRVSLASLRDTDDFANESKKSQSQLRKIIAATQ
ncbi:MAG TPA: hypothetical protein VE890_01845 [Thermoguttaceae bacterium]|nr:hypothetical protein [Thermoguttaceae bacterium]